MHLCDRSLLLKHKISPPAEIDKLLLLLGTEKGREWLSPALQFQQLTPISKICAQAKSSPMTTEYAGPIPFRVNSSENPLKVDFQQETLLEMSILHE
jgi:hypothetical protein